jgi:hypothetical protein
METKIVWPTIEPVTSVTDASGITKPVQGFANGPFVWFISKVGERWLGVHTCHGSHIATTTFAAEANAQHWLALCRADVEHAIAALPANDP